MKIKYYVADAFTREPFGGNPAGVCILEGWLDDTLMRNIAAENNLSETAFVVRRGEEYELRWFTPMEEIDLCGHATLGSAFILSRFTDPGKDVFLFHTRSGELRVKKGGELFVMDFPSRPPRPVDVTPLMREAVGQNILEARLARDLLLLLESEQAVRAVRPDMEKMRAIPGLFGIIVTARGENGADFVSRFFVPGEGTEDAVTGSSHTTLIPFWSPRLGKTDLRARQLSARGGELYCRDKGERVEIAGYARFYPEGAIHIG